MDGAPKRSFRKRPLKAELGIYKCPRNCGWRREFHVDPLWQQDVISHPAYGYITEIALVNLDITSHDCGTYVAAHERLRKAQEARKR